MSHPARTILGRMGRAFISDRRRHYLSSMRLTRPRWLRTAISAFAGFAAFASLAMSTPRSALSRTERHAREVTLAEHATPLPAVREVAGAISLLARPHERSATPFAMAGLHVTTSLVLAKVVHAGPSAAIRGPIRARRLRFRYDATAPPNIL